MAVYTTPDLVLWLLRRMTGSEQQPNHLGNNQLLAHVWKGIR